MNLFSFFKVKRTLQLVEAVGPTNPQLMGCQMQVGPLSPLWQGDDENFQACVESQTLLPRTTSP